MADRTIPKPLNVEEQFLAIKTWRYLRIAIVVLVVGLAVSVGYQFFDETPRRFLTSISAYYYTPVHAYFVGALVAIGICLLCLKGNTEAEDILLNLAGVFAPVVAFVPTPDEDDPALALFTRDEINASVANNMTALFVAGALGLIVGAALSRRQRLPRLALIGYGVAVAVYAAALLWFLIDRVDFIGRAHFVAAALMFICITAAVATNAVAFKEKQRDRNLRNRYLAIALAMVSSALIIGIAGAAGWDHWLLVLEAALIGLFAVFWVIQTEELWNEGLRK